VEGLHSYAVGTAGALVHNADPADYAGMAQSTTKAAATAPDNPTVATPNAGQAPAVSQSGGAKASAKYAPESGTPKPTAEDPKVIREGWVLDGVSPAERKIPWPFNWRKPKNGTWDVVEGKLYFKPNADLEQVAIKYGWQAGDTLPFVKGVPDFSKYAKGGKVNFEVKCVLTGKQNRDTEAIAAELAKQGWEGCKTQADALRKFKELNVTPHHFQIMEDGTHVIQLVDRKLHDTFRHSGTAQLLRGES
ncbi:MAG: HNH endonuclease, partial [Bacteroidales bacterium]|nr:HNH endonuclease [Bacteroidales bacterium]